MAVITTANYSQLKIKFDCGMDPGTHGVIYRTSTYNKIISTSSHDDLMEFANLIKGLQKHDLESVTRIDSTSLSE